MTNFLVNSYSEPNNTSAIFLLGGKITPSNMRDLALVFLSCLASVIYISFTKVILILHVCLTIAQTSNMVTQELELEENLPVSKPFMSKSST